MKRRAVVFLLFLMLSSAWAQEDHFLERMEFPSGLMGRVSYLREEIVFLDLTAEDGVRPGMVFDLYTDGRILRDDAGRPIATTGSRRGSILILRSNNYHSVGRIIEGSPASMGEGQRAFLTTVPEMAPVAVLPLSNEVSEENWAGEFNRVFRERLSERTGAPLASSDQVLRRLNEEFPEWKGVSLTPELARDYGRLLATDRLVEVTKMEDGRVVARLWDAVNGRLLAEETSITREARFSLPAVVCYASVSSGRYRLVLTLHDLPTELLDAVGEADGTYRLMYLDRVVSYRVREDQVTLLDSQRYPVEGIESAHGKWIPDEGAWRGFVQVNQNLFEVSSQEVLPLETNQFPLGEDLAAEWSGSRNAYRARTLYSEPFVDLAVGDLDGDNTAEIILLTQDERMVILNQDRTVLQRSEAGEYQGRLATGDLDRDGRDEIYIASEQAQGFRVYVLEWNEARNEAVRRFGSGILSGEILSLSTIEPEGGRAGRLLIGRRGGVNSVIDVYEVYPE